MGIYEPNDSSNYRNQRNMKTRTTAKSKPEQLVLEFFDRVWHAPHELDAIDDLMAENYRITTAGTTITGRDNFKNWVQKFQKLLLEAKTENIELFFNEAENKVVSRWVCSGKNNGILDLPPDGQFVSFTGIAIWTIKNNKLSECWIERSAFELYQQLTSNEDGKHFV